MGGTECLSLAVHLSSNDNYVMAVICHLVKQDNKAPGLLIAFFGIAPFLSLISLFSLPFRHLPIIIPFALASFISASRQESKSGVNSGFIK